MSASFAGRLAVLTVLLCVLFLCAPLRAATVSLLRVDAGQLPNFDASYFLHIFAVPTHFEKMAPAPPTRALPRVQVAAAEATIAPLSVAQLARRPSSGMSQSHSFHIRVLVRSVRTAATAPGFPYSATISLPYLSSARYALDRVTSRPIQDTAPQKPDETQGAPLSQQTPAPVPLPGGVWMLLAALGSVVALNGWGSTRIENT